MGREGRCKQITLVCVRIVSATPGLPCSRHVCFPCLHCLGSRLLCWELSGAGPGLYALPRSKPLRFRYLGTPQRRRLCWACVLYPSRFQASQVTRCLVTWLNCSLPLWTLLFLHQVAEVTYHLPRSCHSVFWVYNQCIFSGVPCVSSGELISGCNPPGRC